jgi:hypothetical protein
MRELKQSLSRSKIQAVLKNPISGGDNGNKKGWLAKQIEVAEKEYKELPTWARPELRQSGKQVDEGEGLAPGRDADPTAPKVGNKRLQD